jgi:hypothetical protein
MTFLSCFLPCFGSFGQAVTEKNLKESTNQKQELLFCLVHLAKGNVSFCHHLASVVHRPLTRHILMFSPKTTKPNDLKLGRKHLRMLH